MTARAIWKGRLVLRRDPGDTPGDRGGPGGAVAIALKLYSAVQDQAVHFKLLHAADHVPVEQRIVRKDNGKEVPREDQRKAFPLDDERAVVLSPEDLESIEPEASRDIEILRFVPAELLADPWFDRPYFLGPDEESGEGDDACFALAAVLRDRAVMGIARWTMRKKRYLGALGAVGGHLMLTTLRRSEQVLQMPDVRPDAGRTPTDVEVKLAMQLVETISADFEPQAWRNEHRQRLRALIEAKARGEKVRPLPRRPRLAGQDLADGLRASLAAARERKAA